MPIADPFTCFVCHARTGSFPIALGRVRGYLCERCLEHVETSDRPYQWHLWVGMIAFGVLGAIPAAALLLSNWRDGVHDADLFWGPAVLFPAMAWGFLRLMQRQHRALKGAVRATREAAAQDGQRRA